MELRCLRKGSVSYGLGADFSLTVLSGTRYAEPSPAGISEPRAEISWCIVMVHNAPAKCPEVPLSAVFFSLFQPFNFDIKAGKSPEDIVGKEAFHSCHLSCPCQIVDGYCVQFIAFKLNLHIKHVPLKI